MSLLLSFEGELNIDDARLITASNYAGDPCSQRSGIQMTGRSRYDTFASQQGRSFPAGNNACCQPILHWLRETRDIRDYVWDDSLDKPPPKAAASMVHA